MKRGTQGSPGQQGGRGGAGQGNGFGSAGQQGGYQQGYQNQAATRTRAATLSKARTPARERPAWRRCRRRPRCRRSTVPIPGTPSRRWNGRRWKWCCSQPSMLEGTTWERFSEARFSTPAYLAIHEAIRATGLASAADPARWVAELLQEVPEPLRPLVSELSVVPLPASTEEAVQRYCRDIQARLFELQITRVKADKMGQLQRLDAAANPEEFQRLNRELMELEMQRRSLRADS